jgi:hypothetical protein
MVENRADERDVDSLVQLHVAEYNALTTRCTYRIYFQFSIWGILLIYLPLIGLAWNGGMDHAFILWVSALVAQGAVLAWQENLIEIYRSIEYIEQVQRPLLTDLLPGKQFWEYERYLAKDRPNRAVWWEYLFPLLALVAVVGVAVFRMLELKASGSFEQPYWRDLVGAGVNIGALAVLLYSANFAVRIRKQMASARSLLSKA